MSDPRIREVEDEPPPFLRTWPRVYAAIVIYLVLLIVFFGWFTAAFRP